MASTASMSSTPAAASRWTASATGVMGALIAVATVTTLGRRVPRKLMLLVLAVMVLAVGGGAAIMAVDGFIGVGIGWRWYHGLLGIHAMALLQEMTRSYARTTRPEPARATRTAL